IRIIGLGQSAPAGRLPDEVDFKQFWDAWQLLKDKYYEQPVKDKSLFYGAMAGLAASLGDPYTNYFEPKIAQDFQQSLSGKFEGIGAEIAIKEEQLQIVSALPDTPAERAGLLPKDVIAKIDGQDTAGMSTEKAVSLIRGPKGTKVTLSIFRQALKKPPFDVTLIRDEIRIKSVKWKMLPGSIAYIEVTHFNGDTKAGFHEAVQSSLRKGLKGIVLDLRNNPGGYLETSLSMTGAWVGDQVVVKERRQGKIVETLHGTGRAWFAGIPTMVLVNPGSASASEIVAGALQDHHQATIIGQKTFGKGSVQDYVNFTDGSGIKITVAEWVTPNERTINKTGLDPDVLVDRTPEDYAAKRDPQLDRAVAILNGTATSTASTTSTRP
ncbi:MAG: S41 family peptidase, partial [Candidatus Uhrbacteria bacterium]|nr:S41 family peptidase [Candidatus Uhrbacteria bacterium]